VSPHAHSKSASRENALDQAALPSFLWLSCGESADDTGKNAFGSSDSSSESNRSVRSFRVVSCDVDKRLYREDLLQRRRMIPGRPSFEDSA